MKSESFLIQPQLGKIIQIFACHSHTEFQIGYCKAILQTKNYFHFVGGFQRCSDPARTFEWAESFDFGLQRIDRFSFALTDQMRWMTLTNLSLNRK